MISSKPVRWSAAPGRTSTWSSPARRATAAGLQIASAALARLAAYVAVPVAASTDRAPTSPTVEYHTEAGAPEGALYVDGQLVGWLTGIRRL